MLGSEVTSKGQRGPSLEGRGLPALREQSRRVSGNRGVGHPKCDPWQHPADLLQPPWLVLLQETLPAACGLPPAVGHPTLSSLTRDHHGD